MTSDEVIALKASIRERDGMRCTECGMTNDDHTAAFGKSLEVHRITPGSEYSMAGCVTLCRPCHGSKPRLPRGSLPKRPGKLVLIPSDWCDSLEELAREDFNSITEQAKIAVREYLERRDRLPKPKPAR